MEQFLSTITDELAQAFAPELIARTLSRFGANVVIAGSIFVVYLVLWLILARVISGVEKRARLDRTTAGFIRTIAKTVVLTFGALHALRQVGMDPTALAASVGVLGITIGFAARDALSNVISGIFIYWDRPFVIGDLVDTSGRYGRVEAITLRSTRIVTPDGKMLSVPNTEILNSTVASYTNFPHLRLDIDFQIAPDESIAGVRALLLELAREDPDLMEEPAPEVSVTATGDYNNTVALMVWVRDERTHLAKRSELRERAYMKLYDAGVNMPFETLQIEPVRVVSAA